MSQSFLSVIGRFAIRRKWLITGVWAAAFVLCAPFAPRIASALQAGGFSSDSMQSVQAANILQTKLHTSFTNVQIFFTSAQYKATDTQFILQAEAAIQPLTTWNQTTSVISFTTDPRQISTNGHSAYDTVYLNINADISANILPALRAKIVHQPNIQISIGGGPVFYNDIQKVSEDDLRRAELLTFPIALLALLLVFRSVAAAVVPALIGGCSVVVSLALIYFIALHTTVSIFALNITTLFGLGLGVDYSLFMVSRFREELSHGKTVDEAILTTINTAGRAVSVSALAVSIGLLGLLLFNFNVLRSIGAGGAFVVVISLTAALTLLPAILSIVGTRINAFPVRIPFWGKPQAANSAKLSRLSGESKFWRRLSLLVMRRPWQFFIPVIVLLLLLGAPFLQVKLGAPDASILPNSVPSRAAFNLLTQQFNAAETNPIIIAVQTQKGDMLTPQNLTYLETLVTRLQQDPSVARVDSLLTLDPRFTFTQLEYLYTSSAGAQDPYLSQAMKNLVSGNTTVVSVISKYGMISSQSEALVQDIRATNFQGLHIEVTGATAGVVDYVNTLYSQFPLAILLIALTTYIVLALLFKSVILPLKALAMNTLSILSAYGALVFIFQEGHFSSLLQFSALGFVEASAPIVIFCALFGLSMDYEVFLLTRVREEYLKSGDNTQSVAAGMERSGAIITSAATIVIIVSGGFVSANMIIVKALGVGMALAVFMDATLVRGLLAPAAMQLLGDWNWYWPFRQKQAKEAIKEAK